MTVRNRGSSGNTPRNDAGTAALVLRPSHSFPCIDGFTVEMFAEFTTPLEKKVTVFETKTLTVRERQCRMAVLRIGREAKVAFVPGARIVHHGGDASRKGARHVSWFLRSAWRFFATHGWKIA